MTTVTCNHCHPPKLCAGPAGYASHVRAMHPDVARAARQQLDTSPPVASPRRTVPTPSRSDELVWEDPPRLGRPTIVDRLAPTLEQLRANPGRWARIVTFPSKSGGGSTMSKLRKRGPAGYEWRQATFGDGSAVWGRYIDND